MIQCVGVIGCGPMGAGIAQVAAAAGSDVILLDTVPEAAQRARDEIARRLASLERKGKLPAGASQSALSRLQIASDLPELAGCDIVIEAIVEQLDAKLALFSRLEGIVAETAILATNTSSLSVAAIAGACMIRGRICGMHFFNPVPVMRLVEIVRAPDTSDDTIAKVRQLADRFGKSSVTVGDTPGFLVNLQGRAYILEALAIANEQVADAATIDRIMHHGGGFPLGPFALMDLTGIDINLAASTYIYAGYNHDPRLRTTPMHQLMASAGRLGRKTGRGFHDYGDAAAPEQPAPSPDAPFALSARIVEPDERWQPVATGVALSGGDQFNLVAPVGEDCATICARLGLDPKMTVALDLTAADRRHLTVMSAIGGGSAAERVAQWLRSHGFAVEVVQDSPGFVLQRILAMIANLGCELAQTGIANPHEIDMAMKLAQNYPLGPIEIAQRLGVSKTFQIMEALHQATGSDRYRPSLWLRRRALLGLSAYAPPS
ncbi:hypothetical protein IP81_06745 [Novosphingobium sp. AAP83]|uniref:3-hydroxyacyl-CoA dehydrogenase n=1 Tax=Novosphingobium sp. AAP83 TaxID=1523425 RepID=UPI0006B9375B|nr:3-hydroxyacyl-CoA dehydrogenase [Novosphingobium sp. AAP83]KPF92409.1 hypothetical protein IP81_06745 [Novosphingobium sp. AAP83]